MNSASVSLSDLSLTRSHEGVLMEASKLNDVESIRSVLRPYYNALVDEYEGRQPEDMDWRTGSETYGYDSIDSIRLNLEYISDRWRASFRIRWLIELINPDYVVYVRGC